MTTPFSPVNTSQGSKTLRECVLALAVCVFVSALAILPFFRIGEVPNSGCCGGAMPVTHDMAMHLNQMQSFYEGLRAGRLYPRWDGQTNRGFGAPTTIFYPPFTYYLTSLLYFTTRDWTAVIITFYLLSMVASGLAFFALARSLFHRWPALIAAALYLVMPYHLLNHYQRGALAECLSFIFIPLVTLALFKLTGRALTRRQKLKWTAILSLIWGLFIWTHPPTAYQLWLIALPVLVVTAAIAKNWNGLFWIGASVLVGTMTAGAYLLPAVAEQSEVHSDDIERSWPYHESYVLKFSSRRYDHLQDDFVVRVDRIWIYTTILVCAVGLLLTFMRRRKPTGVESGEYRVWLVASVLSAFMMLPVSRAIGAMIPRLEIGVFAWRMLALTSTGLPLLVGYLAAVAFSDEKESDSIRFRRTLRLSVVGCWAAVLFLSFVYVVLPMYRAEAFKPIPEHSNYSLIPSTAGRTQPSRPEATVLEGKGTTSIKLWEPEDRVIAVNMRERGIVSFRLFSYPGWTVWDGTVAKSIKVGPIGEVEVELEDGQHNLELKFRNTFPRNLGVLVSVFGWALTVGIFAFGARLPVGETNQREAE